MATVDTLLVKIEADMSDLRKQLNKSTQAVNKSVKTQQGAFAKLGKTMKTLGVVVAVAMAARFAKSMIDMASGAEEMQSKSSVVFGEFAGSVRDSLETFGDSVGRSTFQLEGMASQIQDTFVPMGFARGEAAKLSVELTKLAVDVASFNNASDEDTMRAFQSALVGNHETVRRFGVVITEATLKQELLRMGVKQNSQDVDNATKVQARLNLILAGTTDAQGDAERTAGSFANQSKALSGALEELVIEAVLPMLPSLAKLVKNLTDATVATKDFLKSVGLLDIDVELTNIEKLAVAFEKLEKAQKKLEQTRGMARGGVNKRIQETANEIKSLKELILVQNQRLDARKRATLEGITARNKEIAEQQKIKDSMPVSREDGTKGDKGFSTFVKLESAIRDVAQANQILTMRINGRTEADIRSTEFLLKNSEASEIQIQNMNANINKQEQLKDTIARRNAEEENTLSINNAVLEQLSSISDANELLQMKINGSTDAEIKKHEAMMANIGASPEFLAVLNDQINLEAKLNKELKQKNLLEGMEVDRKNRLKDLTESLLTPSQELALLQNDLNNAYLEGSIGQEQYALGTEKINEKMLQATESGKLAFDTINKVADGFSESFANALMSGEVSLQSLGNTVKQVMAGLIKDFIKAQIRAMILKMILASMGMGSGTAPSSGPTTISPSGFAGGGKVQGRTPIMVGERGPEMFIPNTGGVVRNNADTKSASSGKPIIVNQSINISTGVAQTVRAEVMNLMPQISQTTISAMLDAKQRGGSFSTIMS